MKVPPPSRVALIVAILIGLQPSVAGADELGSANRAAAELAGCSLVYEWSTRLTFFEHSRPELAGVRRVFSQLRTGMTRDEVASALESLGFNDRATRLSYLFVDGVGDYRPHHRAELRFRDDFLSSIRSPDSIAETAPPEGQPGPDSLDPRPDIGETALTVYLNCNEGVSDQYQLAHMGAWHIDCGMNRGTVTWALHPIPVSDDVDKLLFFVRERPFAHRELHLIVFDGDAVGFVFHDDDG